MEEILRILEVTLLLIGVGSILFVAFYIGTTARYYTLLLFTYLIGGFIDLITYPFRKPKHKKLYPRR